MPNKPRNPIEHYKRLGKITHDKFFNAFPTHFWNQVDKRHWAECWLWNGILNNKGYGYARRCKRRYCSHKWAWILTHGEVPEGMCVLHKCDVPRCCNPNHLWIGTQMDNMRDKIAKGRGNNGKKITREQATEIRHLLSTSASRKYICNRFKVSPQTVCDIFKNRIWKV